MKKEKGLKVVGKHTKMTPNGSRVEKEEMINVALQLEKDSLAQPQKSATSGCLEVLGGWIPKKGRY